MRKTYLIVAVLSACIAASMGCAHLIYPPRGSEEALRQRVAQAWEARKNRDANTLWDMTTDEHKKRVPRESFTYRANVIMTGFSIRDVTIAEGGTTALVQVEMKIRQMGFDFTFPIREEWLWQRGAWRLDLKPRPTEKKGPVPR